MTSFRDLSLREVEEEIVGACLDHETALRIALERLPVDDFRSHVAHDLRQIFYVLVGWLEQGAYDPETNRERLLPLFPDRKEAAGWLGSLWCPWGILPGYVRGLCDALRESNELQDGAVEAVRRWRLENPLKLTTENSPRQATPRPAARRSEHRKGGLGGVPI